MDTLKLFLIEMVEFESLVTHKAMDMLFKVLVIWRHS